jgi:hypothetical protein
MQWTLQLELQDVHGTVGSTTLPCTVSLPEMLCIATLLNCWVAQGQYALVQGSVHVHSPQQLRAQEGISYQLDSVLERLLPADE